MTIETWLAIIAIGIPVAIWGLKKYNSMMADGKISINEGLEALVDGVEIIEDAKDDIKKVIDEE